MASAKSPRLKPLLPSLREKKRYLRFVIFSSGPLRREDVSASIWDAALSLHGEAGAAMAGLWFVPDKYDGKKQEGILRVAHDAVDMIKSSLALMTRIGSESVIVQTTKVSGMINKA